MLSSTEMIIVVAVIMLMFGSSQIPKFAKNLGMAQRELKNALHDDEPEATPAESSPAGTLTTTAPDDT
ncbi:MAG: twin-arginine translocase TatA/TatE family subunit [Ilumatobacter sp.]|uniref:twin-arginine translocase TatA/TatE family subunit n=1 Tax=Ilumatobacter sp. TaxID=1967498 RepID=UPI003C75334C